MTSDFYSQLVGDCFVHRLQMDFVRKETILILGGHPHDAMIDSYVLTFQDVLLQELNHFQEHNICWGMEVSDSYNDFENRESNYLLRRQNYYTPGFLDKLKKDETLKYFFILSTIGLSGFVVCKNATLVTKEN